MGQAKQKQAALANWKGSLSANERTIFAVAEAVHKNIVKALGATGMCYRIAFFLADVLRDKHDITTEHPAVQLPGPLLLLDRAFGTSRANYTYHREQSEASSRLIESLKGDSRYAEAVRHKEREHQRMAEIAASWPAIRAYLDSAPDGLGYAALANRVLIDRSASP
jgi:hypothetical protein